LTNDNHTSAFIVYNLYIFASAFSLLQHPYTFAFNGPWPAFSITQKLLTFA